MELSTKRIRELIACPQFGDDHYGEWRCLAYDQRKAILQLVETIDQLQAEIVKLEAKLRDDLETILSMNREFLKVKSEAYNEFAGRLCDGRVSNDPVVIAAEALLKELTEEATYEIRKDLADL